LNGIASVKTTLKRIRIVVLIAAFLSAAPLALAHGLLHRVVQHTDAVTVQFYFPDDDKPLFEPYQVYGPDSDRPFQTGRINAIGEVSFRTDRPGNWRVEVQTADGHDVRVELPSDGTSDINADETQVQKSLGVQARIRIDEVSNVNANNYSDGTDTTDNISPDSGFGADSRSVPETTTEAANSETTAGQKTETVEGMVMTEAGPREITDPLALLWLLLLIMVFVFGAMFQAWLRWNTRTTLSRIREGQHESV